MSTEYPSLEAFYAGRPERARSGEADYGVHWRAGGRDWPRWRVSYVQATGEVYAFEQAAKSRVRVLGVIPPDDPADDPRGPGRLGRYYLQRLAAHTRQAA